METTSSLVPYVIAGLSFLTCSLLCWSATRAVARAAARRRLLGRARKPGQEADIPARGDEGPRKAEQMAARAARLMDAVGKRIVKEDSADYSKMKVKFVRAGLRGKNVPKVFWGAKGLLALAPGLAWLALQAVSLWGPVAVPPVFVFYGLTALGFYAPDIWLSLKRKRRQELLFQGFPDALDLLVVCVEAGMAMDAAIHRVAREMELSNPVLSDELKMYTLEVRAGLTRQEGLQRLAARVDLQDVYALVSLLIQTDKFGTSLVSALKVYAETFRRRRYMKVEEKAAKLPPKLTFPLIGFVFPPLLVFTVGPAFIKLLAGLRQIMNSL